MRFMVRHGVPYVGTGRECACVRYDCGGVVLRGCAEHGDAAGPVLEWHVGGGGQRGLADRPRRRGLPSHHPRSRAAVHDCVCDYVHAVVERQWPLMREGRGDAAVTAAGQRICAGVIFPDLERCRLLSVLAAVLAH
ncbi:hypothetical protein GCM10010493_82310 [Streptomyces lavendulae subsp. grasserius]